MKLTIEQLKNYLGTHLKAVTWFDGQKLDRYLNVSNINNFIDKSTDAKLLFYRLSDLDKFIPELGFVPLDELYFEAGHSRDVQNKGGMMLWKKSNFEMLLYAIPSEILFGVIQKLFQWHFWPFGDEYFEDGLVIDKLLYNSPSH